MYKEAMRGNVFAAKFLTERHEGLPKQEVDIATNGGIEQINVNMSLDELSGLYAESLRYGDVIEATALPSVGAPQPASSSTSARNGSSNCSSAPRAGGSIPRIRRSKR
jgi:hypothetical protein